MRSAVVTIVSGRHEHLRAQRRMLAAQHPDLHVVVGMADDGLRPVLAEQPDLPTRSIAITSPTRGLPLAAARNAGAEAALAAGADVLVMLDVDCIPGPQLLERYAAAAADRPDALLSGPVTYLPPAPPDGWTTTALSGARSPHPARPDPPAGALVDAAGPQLFWSLSFAVDAATWRHIGGFHPGYVGYGAEDTDFAVVAAKRGHPLVWVGGADAFHQHHDSGEPALRAADDILRNGGVFARRHRWWPMTGWLDELREAGIAEPQGRTWIRSVPVRVASIPPRHPYVDAVLPPTVRPALPDRVSGWRPDPLLRLDVLRRHAASLDIVHLHFGFEHLSEQQLTRWLDTLDALGLPLVVTVHDLRNPHQLDAAPHHAHLARLAAAAHTVLTLTEGAATAFADRYGRRPEVLPHPSVLLDGPLPAPRRRRGVTVGLKAMRPNVHDVEALVRGVCAGAGDEPVVVLVEDVAAGRPETGVLRDLADGGRIELRIEPYLPDADLIEAVASARAWILPYRFGTHSGLLEMCRDLGTPVVAPTCGHYAEQWPAANLFGNDERDGLDVASLAAAVRRALTMPAPERADRAGREAERDVVRARHDEIYRDLRR